MAQFPEEDQKGSLDGPETAPEGEIARHVGMEKEVELDLETLGYSSQPLRWDGLEYLNHQVHRWQHDLIEDDVGKKYEPCQEDEDVVEEESVEHLQTDVTSEG